MALYLRKVVHPQAHENYCVILKLDDSDRSPQTLPGPFGVLLDALKARVRLLGRASWNCATIRHGLVCQRTIRSYYTRPAHSLLNPLWVYCPGAS
jgi:hypothetical protein